MHPRQQTTIARRCPCIPEGGSRERADAEDWGKLPTVALPTAHARPFHYAVDAREWDRVQARIAVPVLIGDRASGWLLEFCSVFGWMHDKQGLIHHRCRFSPEFCIAHETEVLSRRIFERTPSVRY